VDTAANIFGKACGYGGLQFSVEKEEYHSNIKRLAQLFSPAACHKKNCLANINDVNLLAASTLKQQ